MRPVREDNPRLLLAVLLALGIALFVTDARGVAEPVTSVVRTAGAAAFTPVSAGVSVAAAPAAEGWQMLTAAPDATERIQRLEAENAELRRELTAREFDAERAEQLQELLQLSDLGGYDVVPAQAVTRVTARGQAPTVTLDVGTADGVAADQTVVHADGLVGRVVQAGAHRATVMLLTDAGSAVGTRMEGSGETGAVHGQAASLEADAALRLELLDSSAEVAEDDRVVTMGSHDGSPFVPGVPVGTVTRVLDTPGTLTSVAELRPAVDLSRLDVVGVVVGGPGSDPGDSLLPDETEEDSQA